MTEYVDRLEEFVDQANTSIKDLVKRSLEKLQGKRVEPEVVEEKAEVIEESEESVIDEEEEVRRFYHAVLDRFLAKRYLKNGLVKFHDKVHKETHAEK